MIGWGVILHLSGENVSIPLFKPFSMLVTLLLAIGILFEYWAWKVFPFRLFITRPNINGTWKVDILPADEGRAPIEAYVAIKQSFSSIKLHLMTPESESWLQASNIIPSAKNDTYQFIGMYTSQPKAAFREQSPIHNGAFALDTHYPKQNPSSMSGEYFTDRKSTGSMQFTARIDNEHNDYRSAKSAFSEKH